MSLGYVTPAMGPRRFRAVVWVSAALLIAGACAGGYWGVERVRTSLAAQELSSSVFYHVTAADLDIVIHQSGELTAVKNADIVCPVEGQSTIVKIVPEGTLVKAGDIVVELDSSDIKKKIQTSTLDVRKAESDLAAARQQLSIQQSKNTADLEAAEVELTIAQLDLREYTDGKYPADLLVAQREMEMAELTLKDKQEALANTKKLLAKGFSTFEEEKKAEVEVITAQNALEKATTARDVMIKYTHEKELVDKTDKVRQAQKKVERTKNENESNLAEKTSDAQGKEQALLVNQQMLDHLNEQLAFCTIKAPAAGIVLYGAGGGNGYSYYGRDQPIGPGVKVQEQEPICRLPDTSAMKVVLRVPEASVGKLKSDTGRKMRAGIKLVGIDHPIGGWVSNIAVVADSARRWWDPDSKEFPVEVTLDLVPPGVKPGASAQVEIFIDHLANVIAIPPGAIYSAGSQSFVFLKTDRGITPVSVSTGQMSDTLVQITSGISAGSDVLLLQPGQGHELVEKAHLTPAPTSQPAHDFGAPAAALSM